MLELRVLQMPEQEELVLLNRIPSLLWEEWAALEAWAAWVAWEVSPVCLLVVDHLEWEAWVCPIQLSCNR